MEAAERETTIQWSDADEVAHVWTAQAPVARRLRKIRGAVLKETSRGPQGQWWGEEWEVPLKAVLPRNPRSGGVIPQGHRFQKKQPGDSPRQVTQDGHPGGQPRP